VDTILSLSKNLGLETVAEGIESEQQLFYLLNHGCAYGQGYYFAKPLTSADVPRYLTEHQ
jgi:EAL domain-containing protein (putative c-di-GMP-specific phosphodiesterase class I)